MALSPFDLAGYFVDDSNELIAARSRSKKLHGNKDIDASGDEVEIPIREILQRRLSRRYYVGHGHIVDCRLTTGPQIDVIIADELNTPVLCKAKNGSEYVPYESVYGVGEGKSTYYKNKKPIQAFSGVLSEISSGLERQRITFAMGTNGMTNVIRQSPFGLNPLFSFMLFVNGDEFEFADVASFYESTPINLLPSAVCILNKGVIVRAAAVKRGDRFEMGPMIVNPETAGKPEPPDEHRWVFIRANVPDEEKSHGFSLAILCLLIFGSLSQSAVLPPEMSSYLGNALLTFPTSMESVGRVNSSPKPVSGTFTFGPGQG